jgi:hypothetical protein
MTYGRDQRRTEGQNFPKLLVLFERVGTMETFQQPQKIDIVKNRYFLNPRTQKNTEKAIQELWAMSPGTFIIGHESRAGVLSEIIKSPRNELHQPNMVFKQTFLELTSRRRSIRNSRRWQSVCVTSIVQASLRSHGIFKIISIKSK